MVHWQLLGGGYTFTASESVFFFFDLIKFRMAYGWLYGAGKYPSAATVMDAANGKKILLL